MHFQACRLIKTIIGLHLVLCFVLFYISKHTVPGVNRAKSLHMQVQPHTCFLTAAVCYALSHEERVAGEKPDAYTNTYIKFLIRTARLQTYRRVYGAWQLFISNPKFSSNSCVSGPQSQGIGENSRKSLSTDKALCPIHTRVS